MEHFDGDTLMVFVIAMTNILWIYFHCLWGKLVTDQYDEWSNHLYDSKWYELPIGLQKYFIVMLANMQKPFYFHGFKVYVLNLETFTKVSRTEMKKKSFFRWLKNLANLLHIFDESILLSFSDNESSLFLLYDV